MSAGARGTERRGRAAVVILAPLLPWLAGGCDEAGSDDVLAVEASGTVAARLVFDANGSGHADQADEFLQGWTLNLDQPAGGTVVSGVTDDEGTVLFEEVPVGRLVPALPEEEKGDTLLLVPSTVEPFTLAAQQEVGVQPVLTLPSYAVEEVKELPAGLPLFVEGVALNGFSQDHRVVHLKGGTGYLRVRSVEEGNVSSGDSVRVAGRTALDQGVPVLDGKAVFRLGTAGATVQPVSLTTAEAAGARGGELDAALVRVEDCEVLDVIDQGDQGVRVVLDDGSGPLVLRFQAFLEVDEDVIEPGTHRFSRAVGLLVPARIGGAVEWELQPRSVFDVMVVRQGD